MATNHDKLNRNGRDAKRWLALAGMLALLACGCDLPGKPDPANRPVEPGQVMSFALLYRQNCAGCHGADGKLGPAPPLNDPLFLSIVSKDDLLQVIRNGRAGTPMPAFDRTLGGGLTEEQIVAVAEGIHATWKSSGEPAARLPAYQLAAADNPQQPPGDAKRGAKVFAAACAVCHGPNGQGEDGMAGAINDVAFLSLISNQALRRIVITGRPDLGMPNYADEDVRSSDYKPLTSAEIDDLVALMAAWRAGDNVARREKSRDSKDLAHR